jgi:hypothetical protein
MKMQDVEQIMDEVQPLIQRTSTKCDFTAGVHKLLSDMARRSGPIEAAGLRAAAGAITKLRRKLGCIQ